MLFKSGSSERLGLSKQWYSMEAIALCDAYQLDRAATKVFAEAAESD
jgi:hypothetical protein